MTMTEFYKLFSRTSGNYARASSHQAKSSG